MRPIKNNLQELAKIERNYFTVLPRLIYITFFTAFLSAFPGYISTLMADVFDYQDQQQILNKSISADNNQSYNRFATDVNISPVHTRFSHGVDHFTRTRVPSGLGSFDLRETLKNQILKPDLSTVDINTLMTNLSFSPLMTYQYTSPAQADLYKHAMTLAHLRLILRYVQLAHMDDDLQDPLTSLRHQAQLDCLRRSGGLDIDQAFIKCLDAREGVKDAFRTLNDPRGESGYLQGSSELVEESLGRAKSENDIWEDVKSILPRFSVLSNRDFRYEPASLTISKLFVQRKTKIIGTLTKATAYYKIHQEIKESDLNEIKPYLLNFNEREIRQLFLLDQNQQVIAMHKIASIIALRQTNDLCQRLTQWLNRAINHPQIEPGVKKFLMLAQEEVQQNWELFKNETRTIKETHQETQSQIQQFDQERIRIMNDYRKRHE